MAPARVVPRETGERDERAELREDGGDRSDVAAQVVVLHRHCVCLAFPQLSISRGGRGNVYHTGPFNIQIQISGA